MVSNRQKKRRKRLKIKKAWVKKANTLKWILEPFGKKLGWFGLVKRWLLFIILGFIAMGVVQAFGKYDFEKADTLISETGEGCDQTAMLLLLLLPPVEELLFRIGPHRFFGKDAALTGTIVWALLHLFGRNPAIVAFQLVVGIFYFKLVVGGCYKETIVFHEIFNLVPFLTCLLL